MKIFLSFTCEDIGVAMVTNINFNFLEQNIIISIIVFINFLLYNLISEFHNIFVTGILR